MLQLEKWSNNKSQPQGKDQINSLSIKHLVKFSKEMKVGPRKFFHLDKMSREKKKTKEIVSQKSNKFMVLTIKSKDQTHQNLGGSSHDSKSLLFTPFYNHLLFIMGRTVICF